MRASPGPFLLLAIMSMVLAAGSALGMTWAQEAWVGHPLPPPRSLGGGEGGPPFDPAVGPVPPGDPSEGSHVGYRFLKLSVPARPGDTVRMARNPLLMDLYVYDSHQLQTSLSLPVYPLEPYVHVPPAGPVEVRREAGKGPAMNATWADAGTPEGLVFFWVGPVVGNSSSSAWYDGAVEWLAEPSRYTIVEREYVQVVPWLTVTSFAGVLGMAAFGWAWRRAARSPMPTATFQSSTSSALLSMDSYLRRLNSYMWLAGALLAAFGVLACLDLYARLVSSPSPTQVWHLLPLPVFATTVIGALIAWGLDLRRVWRERRRLRALKDGAEPF